MFKEDDTISYKLQASMQCFSKRHDTTEHAVRISKLLLTIAVYICSQWRNQKGVTITQT